MRNDSYKRGYSDALTHGPAFCIAGKHATYVNGFLAGVHAIYISLPPSVHHMLQLVCAHAASHVDASFAMTTPPLSIFSRHSLHLILLPVRDMISVTVKGHEQHRECRVEIRYGGPARVSGKARCASSATPEARPSPQVQILRRADRHDTNASVTLETKQPVRLE